jgi:3-methyl-2-oxobutanoate hydroxymethyltransferase
MSTQSDIKPKTTASLRRMKEAGEKIACLSAYDAAFARLADEVGVDLVLVGDSLGMVVQGHETTIPVSMEDMIYHARCVARGNRMALRVVDMPFMSYTSAEQAVANAARLMREGGAQMVKLEGGAAQVKTVARLSEQGVPVCAHLGLRPQSVHKLGGYRVQGRDEHDAVAMLEVAGALREAGADLLLLECVPGLLAAEITANVDIPVIGIGAGLRCDGQILVLHDVLGIIPGKAPRFTRDFMAEGGSIRDALRRYVQGVKEASFPGPEHTF